MDEGKPEDIAFARQILDEELGDTGIEWIYAPGNHEAMSAPGMEPWYAEFGPGYGVEYIDGTRLIYLDSHPYNISHNPQQISFLRDQLHDAMTNSDITGVVLALHHPTQDNVTGNSALNRARDSRLIENWMAEVYASGKSALVLNAGVGAFDVYQVAASFTQRTAMPASPRTQLLTVAGSPVGRWWASIQRRGSGRRRTASG